MNITFIAGTYRPEHCGVADYTAHLRHYLTQRGMHSTVLTTHAAATSDPTVQGAIAHWNIANLLPLAQAICKTQTDILHIQHAAGTYQFDRSMFLLPPLLRSLRFKAPIITTIHEYGWWEWQPQGIPPQWIEHLKMWGQNRGWWDREDGFLLTYSNAIITTNEIAQTTIQTRLPNLKASLHQIPIGANVEVAKLDRGSSRQHLRQSYHWSTDTPVIAFFGFLHPVKGLEVLLHAFQQVLTCHPQARLLLIGGVESLSLPGEQAENYWNKLKQLIQDLKLTTAVEMTGYLQNESVSQMLLGSDIGVIPFNHGVTLKSGSLLALMAHALPIVATRSTPSDPKLENNPALKLVLTRSSDALAEKLILLLEDHDLRNRLSQAAQQFSQDFSWKNIADRHLAIYQAVQ
ncbi:MAG: glycosyltransferase [Leptolyngbya sp. Prado105]|jgi:glycosyltransferase involved in cell wall biosynthesis|nr:glycosyltransferase [Leptolyngbya sp. Prado105]